MSEYLIYVLTIRKDHLTTGEERDIDYYGVTFDHLVGESEEDPEVLALNLIEMDYDGGAFAKGSIALPYRPRGVQGQEGVSGAEVLPEEKGNAGPLEDKRESGVEGFGGVRDSIGRARLAR